MSALAFTTSSQVNFRVEQDDVRSPVDLWGDRLHGCARRRGCARARPAPDSCGSEQGSTRTTGARSRPRVPRGATQRRQRLGAAPDGRQRRAPGRRSFLRNGRSDGRRLPAQGDSLPRPDRGMRCHRNPVAPGRRSETARMHGDARLWIRRRRLGLSCEPREHQAAPRVPSRNRALRTGDSDAGLAADDGRAGGTRRSDVAGREVLFNSARYAAAPLRLRTWRRLEHRCQLGRHRDGVSHHGHTKCGGVLRRNGNVSHDAPCRAHIRPITSTAAGTGLHEGSCATISRGTDGR